MTWPNPNMTAYPYDRTFPILTQFGTSPSLTQASQLAMWIRSQNGEPCVVDGTGCVLTSEWVTAVVKGVNWRPTETYATKWQSNVKWRGLSSENRRALVALNVEFTRTL